MKEQLEQYIKKVKALHTYCTGNEAKTKASLIAPLFVLLGWDLSDPRECEAEYRADFGKGTKAAHPVDWMFALSSGPAFIVEAKETTNKLKSAEQLSMYFAQAMVNLGIFTNGIKWQFYTDLDALHLMDKEPFLSWDILNDDPIPLDFLTILQRNEFKPQLVKTFAEKGKKQTLLVNTLNTLLEPSDKFIRLAIESIETRALHQNVLKEWKPILANAIQEWVKLKALDMALERPNVDLVMPTDSAKTTKTFVGKTCPSCGASKLGYKLQKCKCGYEFPQKADKVIDAQAVPVIPVTDFQQPVVNLPVEDSIKEVSIEQNQQEVPVKE